MVLLSIQIVLFFLQASNAYINFFGGSGVKILLEYVKDMPKVGTKLKFEIASVLGAVFFTWIIELLFPVSLRHDLMYVSSQIG
jgi:hypothetical protein